MLRLVNLCELLLVCFFMLAGECSSEESSPPTEEATTIDLDNQTVPDNQSKNSANTGGFRTYKAFAKVLCPAGFVLNALSFAVFWRMKKKQKHAIILVLLALSVADPLATLVSADYLIWMNLGYSWGYNTDIGCKLIPYFQTVARSCSNVFCLLVAVERFVSVYFPFQVSLWCTRKRMKFVIPCIVVMFACLESYLIPKFYLLNVHQGVYYCTRTSFVVLDLVITRCLGFLVPWLAIGILNFLIIVRLRKVRSKRKSLGAKTTGSNTGLTLMFLAMSLFSLAMNVLDLSDAIHMLRTRLSSQRSLDESTLEAGFIMVLCSHSCNFVFYAMGGSTFRRTFANLITCGKIFSEGRQLCSLDLT